MPFHMSVGVPCAAGEPNSFPPAGRLVEVEELVLPSNPDGSVNSNFRSPGKMLRVTRPIGGNTCGMVAWIMHLKTPECPQARTPGAETQSLRACTWECSTSSTFTFLQCQCHGRGPIQSCDVFHRLLL